MLEINYVVLYYIVLYCIALHCIVLYIMALCFTRQIRDSNTVMCVIYIVYFTERHTNLSRVDIPSSDMCSRTVTLLRRLMLILTMSKTMMSGDKGDAMYYVFQLDFVFWTKYVCSQYGSGPPDVVRGSVNGCRTCRYYPIVHLSVRAASTDVSLHHVASCLFV